MVLAEPLDNDSTLFLVHYVIFLKEAHSSDLPWDSGTANRKFAIAGLLWTRLRLPHRPCLQTETSAGQRTAGLFRGAGPVYVGGSCQ